jgi:hypothetical protein
MSYIKEKILDTVYEKCQVETLSVTTDSKEQVTSCECILYIVCFKHDTGSILSSEVNIESCLKSIFTILF